MYAHGVATLKSCSCLAVIIAETCWLCGVGVCGIALSMAGAQVILTDLSHITPLTAHNLKVNCGDHQQHSKVS